MDNNKNPFISIIIPVYNTERYLKRCLDSVVNQTFKNIEIIVVNDYSPNTEECERIVYSYNDDRIKYIKNECNKGVLVSRKNGSKIALGEYIIYVDSDDALDLNACKEVFLSLENSKVDILHFSMKAISDNNSNNIIKFVEWYGSSNRHFINEDFLFFELIEEKIPHNLCGKAYKVELIKRTLDFIPDVPINNAEDMLHSLIIFYFANSYKAINSKLYYYYTNIGESKSNDNSNNISLEKYKTMCEFTIKAIDAFYSFLRKNNIDILYGDYYYTIYYNQYNFLKNKISNNNKEFYSILDNYFDINIINRYLYLKEYESNKIKKYSVLVEKLLPYFFSIILNEYYINIRLFGIKINLKISYCFNEPIIISFNSLLKNIFSVGDKYIKILFIKIRLK